VGGASAVSPVVERIIHVPPPAQGTQAGGQPASVVQVGCELQRDWARQETAEGFTQILFGGDSPLAGARSVP